MQYAYLSDSVKIKKISDDGHKGSFDIEGLFPGYGLTLGNSLRRVLISSLPGAAVTQFKVKGILHEFSTIPGVLEDVVEIGMNLKKLRFRFTADEPQVLTIKIKGEKEVTGADIEVNTQAEIVNPDQKLFTVTDKKANVEMDLTVEKGLGYVPVERRKSGKLEIGVIALDAVFTPVVNVAINMENMRVGDRTDYNRLNLAVETDGSISPSEAVHKASRILVDHFTKISNLGNELENQE
ncbi:MAG: DNA-directed RNA polymerase subunit alpha [Parcubacteria group bacterium]